MLCTKYVNVYAALLDLFVGPVYRTCICVHGVTIDVVMVSQGGL